VLVVDDAPAIRLLCRVNLELDGHVVHEAATLDEAQIVLAAEDVEIVLLDVHVAGRDGFELVRVLRRERPDVAVAMLTGTAELEAIRGRPVEAVLGKPFEIDDLRALVRELGRGRQGR
jgi:two-component system, OmpR family, alkaline phosphatase synthesis response regulator PhoP